jgi:sulfide:quinone oxidoreductase
MTRQSYEFLILGGGTGGISVAARLSRAVGPGRVAVVEPSTTHDYQPLWTLAGAGVCRREITRRSTSKLIPSGVGWVHDAVARIDPAAARVHTVGGDEIEYRWLVVALGIQLDWTRIAGLETTIGTLGTCSVYSYDLVDSVWNNIRDFRGGTAVFTHPAGPVKCGGAPQKIMYLAADHWRRAGILAKCRIRFFTAQPKLFPVARYLPALERVVARYGCEVNVQRDLKAVDATSRRAIFRDLGGGPDQVAEYDMLHVVPPMRAPISIAASGLADSSGFVEVDRHTLQHVRHQNVFALGDASNLPTPKTGAGIRKQAPVLVANLLAARAGSALPASYDGYTSCPLITARGKVVLAEFDYDLAPKETFPFDQSIERRSMYWLKRYLLPKLYWHGMMKGRL